MRNKSDKDCMGGCHNYKTDTHKGKDPQLSPFHSSGREKATDRTPETNIKPPAKEYPQR